MSYYDDQNKSDFKNPEKGMSTVERLDKHQREISDLQVGRQEWISILREIKDKVATKNDLNTVKSDLKKEMVTKKELDSKLEALYRRIRKLIIKPASAH